MSPTVGRVFVSHASADKAFVDRLVGDLGARGVPVWYDRFDLRVGDSVTGKIDEGLALAKYFLIVLSKSAVSSRWVREELNAALMQQVARGGTFVLPAIIEECTIPPLVAHRRYADFRTRYEAGLDDLLAVWGLDSEAAQVAGGKPLYPWPDLALPDGSFVYLHSTRFDKFFRMPCALSETVEQVIDRIIGTLKLPWSKDVPELGMKWSFGYRLVFDDKALGLSRTLSEAGVSCGSVVRIAINGTYKDLWEDELKEMWHGTKIYNFGSAQLREAELKEKIRGCGRMTAERLRQLSDGCFNHV